MNKTKIITILLVLFSFIELKAQEATVKKGFLIIQSTKDYSAALRTAKLASQKLNIDMNLRGYYHDKTEGLKTDSICGCGEDHGYIARGRYDDGEYISIEYSDNYTGFAEGYYIVVAASNRRNNRQLSKTLKKAKRYYKDAYVKNASVYIGCMH